MRESAKELIKFWNSRKVPKSGRRVHEDDISELVGREALLAPDDSPIANLKQYLQQATRKDPAKFHTSLAPVPYLGDLNRSDIILLVLNPVVGFADYVTDADERYQAALEATIGQAEQNQAHVCLGLDIEYAWTSWFYYYERLFRPVIWDCTEDERLRNKCATYGDALSHLAKRLVIVELVPYYSSDARKITPRFLEGLTSARLARAYAKEVLAEAAAGKVTVIVRWNSRDDRWNLGEEEMHALHVNSRTGLSPDVSETIRSQLTR